MPELDLDLWAVVAHKDDAGFGRMAMMLKTALGIHRHVVIPSVRLDGHPLEPPFETLLSPEANVCEVEAALQGLQGIVFFERHAWHPELVATAKRMGVRTICVPMWEWFKGHEPTWQDVDFLACPSRWSLKVVRSFGHTRSDFVNWPLDIQSLPSRRITGPARVFIHNAGLVDSQDRKGTSDAILAFKRVRDPALRLIVRMQKEAPMPTVDSRIDVRIGNLANHSDLYQEGDVAIQPSKMEGIGFMVLEPYCCGMPVITTNYPPMNEYITDPRLLVKPRWGKRRAFPTVWIPHAHLRIPQVSDLARKIAWCAENDMTQVSENNRHEAERRYDSVAVREEWSEVLSRVLKA